jgi:hypothetical protein
MAAPSGNLARARFALVGAVAAGLLLALTLATSPQLHELVHPDAGQPLHSCLVTILQAGGSEVVLAAVVAIPLVVASVAKVPLRDSGMVESFFLRCRRLEHGPPRFLLS